MGKKRSRRIKLTQRSPKSLKAIAAGKVVSATRKYTLIRLLDSAILLWFSGGDPFAVNMLVCAAYNVLHDLGKESGKGPVLMRTVGEDMLMTVYDFLRHASPKVPNDSVDMSLKTNDFLLFDGIVSFSAIFGQPTVLMQTFQARFAMTERASSELLQKEGHELLPPGVTVEEVSGLGRSDFFDKVAPLFKGGV